MPDPLRAGLLGFGSSRHREDLVSTSVKRGPRQECAERSFTGSPKVITLAQPQCQLALLMGGHRGRKTQLSKQAVGVPKCQITLSEISSIAVEYRPNPMAGSFTGEKTHFYKPQPCIIICWQDFYLVAGFFKTRGL
jgi:hypothetical protein